MSGGNAKKKSSTHLGRFFSSKKKVVTATSPEAELPPKKEKAKLRKKKSGVSTESTARSVSSKCVEANPVSWLPMKATLPAKGTKEKTKSDEKAPAHKQQQLLQFCSVGVEELQGTDLHGILLAAALSPKVTRKKKSKQMSRDDNSGEERKKRSCETTKQQKSGGKKEPKTAVDDEVSSTSMRKQIVKEFARMCNRLTIEELTELFNGLPDPSKDECKAYLDPRNADKNRYYNVYCLDRSRVMLRFLEHEGSYIHANRVEYSTLKSPFIITQGPLNKTVNDFWRLVWQERSEFIVMLCKAMEDGRKKTVEYIPREEGEVQVYGSLRVKATMRDSDNGGVITTRLVVDYKDQQRVVIHYQLTEWSDCRAPVNCVRQMFTLLKNIRCSNFPLIVHCSAGIGRSGTLVALEMCLMDLATGVPLDVDSVVRTLRKHRCHAVQTLEQYVSIYRFILLFGEHNECVTQTEVARFNKMFQEYSSSL